MLEAVRNFMDEGKKLGAVDFSSVVTSTLNSTWSLATKIFRDSTALIGTGSCGPGCIEGGEDVITHEKKLWCYLKNFDCSVTNTWVDVENRECRVWRAWGSPFRKKQFDCVVRDLVSTTWCLNKT